MNSIIRESIDNASGIYDGVCEHATSNSTNCLDCFKRQFFGNNEVCYDCTPKTNIYVGRYFPVHVKENMEALNLLPDNFIERLLALDTINIMNIGGGPGSDSFAIKTFLMNLERGGQITSPKNIYLLRVDKEESWNQIAGFINGRIANTNNLIFDARKSSFNVTQKSEWNLNKNRKYHIFTMSYFLSEIDQIKTRVVANFINSFASDNIAAIIVNDNNRYKIHNLKSILFNNLTAATNYESENSKRYHCGFSYTDEDREFIKPKLNTKSIRYIKILSL